MVIDPYALLSKCFATWNRVRILMVFIMIWCIILASLSGWMTIAYGGDFSGLSFPSQRSYSDWSGVCNSAPYNYLSPFQFTYSGASYNGSSPISSSNPTICPFPSENSDLRLVITTVGFVTVGTLFFKTPLSLFANMIWAVYALLFFSAFVIDANAANTGLTYCQSTFQNSNLNADINSLSMSITCNSDNFAGIAVIDLMISAFFFILYAAWGLTKNLYIDGGSGAKKGDHKSLMKNAGDDSV